LKLRSKLLNSLFGKGKIFFNLTDLRVSFSRNLVGEKQKVEFLIVYPTGPVIGFFSIAYY